MTFDGRQPPIECDFQWQTSLKRDCFFYGWQPLIEEDLQLRPLGKKTISGRLPLIGSVSFTILSNKPQWFSIFVAKPNKIR